MNILLACTGNTCRSPMAAGLLRRLAQEVGLEHIDVKSAGLSAWSGQPVSQHSVTAMQWRGVDISDHTATPLTEPLIRWADLILVMTSGHKRQLQDTPGIEGKLYTLGEYAAKLAPTSGSSQEYGDVPDPIGQPLAAYEETAEHLERLLRIIVESLKTGEEQ